MIEIKAENVIRVGHQFDYELENGTLLHSSEWNGEKYIVDENGVETIYLPVYGEEDECGCFPIVGFERI